MEPDSPLSSDPPPPPPPSLRGESVGSPEGFATPAASSEWDLPPGQSANAPGRAGVLLWILAGLNIVVFGGCSALMAVVAATPPERLRQASPQLTAEQVTQIYAGIWPWIVLMLALGFLPGVVYLIVAFGVRRGKLLSTNLAMTIVLTQAIVVGVLLLDKIVQSFADGNPVELTVAVLILGTYLGLLVYALVWLWRARVAGYGNINENPESWRDANP